MSTASRPRPIRRKAKLTPADHGRRMSLRKFEPAEWQEGYLYELARGIVIESDVPGLSHLVQIANLRDCLIAYKLTHPGEIRAVLSTMECKVLVEDLESERHPDLAIFKQLPPPKDKR